MRGRNESDCGLFLIVICFVTDLEVEIMLAVWKFLPTVPNIYILPISTDIKDKNRPLKSGASYRIHLIYFHYM